MIAYSLDWKHTDEYIQPTLQAECIAFPCCLQHISSCPPSIQGHRFSNCLYSPSVSHFLVSFFPQMVSPLDCINMQPSCYMSLENKQDLYWSQIYFEFFKRKNSCMYYQYVILPSFFIIFSWNSSQLGWCQHPSTETPLIKISNDLYMAVSIEQVPILILVNP